MVGYNMTWGATTKEIEASNFFIEVPKIAKRFKFSMFFALVGFVGMVFLAFGPDGWVPDYWHIRDFVAILPLATVTGSVESGVDDVFVVRGVVLRSDLSIIYFLDGLMT